MTINHIVIVGTGAAGYAVADGLHQANFEGKVTMIGEETEDPYDRPPLSKEILAGKWEQKRAALISAKRSAPLNPDVITGVRATKVDAMNHTLHLSDGRSINYDALVVATGVTPRRLAHPESPKIRVLRTMQDSLALKGLLEGNPRLVVVGAGFLGLEVAATATELGASVTVIEPIPGPPLASRIGEVAAKRLLALHQAHGVDIHTGVGVKELAVTGDTITVTRADGVTIEADAVLIAVGSTATTDWLEGSGLPVENGLVCDEYCDAGYDVWGAGDVASWLHIGYGLRLRLEHRTNAQEQGQHVARNILGANEPFTPVPYFWTDHYGTRVQLCGVIPMDADVAIVEGEADGEQFIQTFGRDGTVGAVLAWNAPRLLGQYRTQLTPAPL